MNPESTIQFTIETLLPQRWITNLKSSSFWVAGYKMYRVPNEVLPKGPQILDFDVACAIFNFGSCQYLDARAVDIQFNEHGEVILQGFSKMASRLPEGAYLFLVAPFDIDGKPGNEKETHQLIDEIIGLMISFEGRNIAFQHLYDNVIELHKPGYSVISPVVFNPFSLPAPDISQSRIQVIAGAYKQITELPTSLSNRIKLSLRWFEAATYDLDLDAFLKYWIALEILSMSSTTDIRPIKEYLAKAYNISMEEVGETFHIGRLYGLRSRIVHEGFNPVISIYLLDYISKLYTDVLSQIIGSPFEMRAGKFIAEQGVNPLTFIPT
jgi:hypothetical protein